MKSYRGIILNGNLVAAVDDAGIKLSTLEVNLLKDCKSYLDIVGSGNLAVAVGITLDNCDSVYESAAVIISKYDTVARSDNAGGLNLTVLAVNLHIIAAEEIDRGVFGKSEQIILAVQLLNGDIVTADNRRNVRRFTGDGNFACLLFLADGAYTFFKSLCGSSSRLHDSP